MPLVAHVPLPAFDQLRQRGQNIVTPEHALRENVRELHIGLLNMMPDAALSVTEQQFIGLLGVSKHAAQIYVYPFTIPGLSRNPEAQRHIDKYYSTIRRIQHDGLDALIITGANVSNPTLEEEPFWKPLQAVVNWAVLHVTSILCSCLATHALVKQLYNIDRKRLQTKRWGVFSHRITQLEHPLLRGIATQFDVPHSRYNEVRSDQMRAAGLNILVESVEGEAHMAVSHDQFRIVYFQGHPEYSTSSLLKEYKREVARFFNSDRHSYPADPKNYFVGEAAVIANNYRQIAITSQLRGEIIPAFPEKQIESLLDNTWRHTSKLILSNWLDLVYELSHHERSITFAAGVNPDDPLGLVKRNK